MKKKTSQCFRVSRKLDWQLFNRTVSFLIHSAVLQMPFKFCDERQKKVYDAL